MISDNIEYEINTQPLPSKVEKGNKNYLLIIIRTAIKGNSNNTAPSIGTIAGRGLERA